MARPFTVDASVFLSAFNPSEAGHAESHRALTWLQEQATPIVVPTLMLPEVAATISRVRGDAALARDFAKALSRLPNLVLVTLDATLAQQAADVAAQYRLRGSDAVYAAVALRFGSVLMTLDHEQRERLDPVVTSYYPAEVVADIKDKR